MAERQLTAMKVAGVGLGLVLLCCIWCWRWPYWCPICPNCSACADCASCAACEACDGVEECCGNCPDGVSAADIVVEDTHTAVWMMTDNEWVEDAGDPDHWVCDAADNGGETPTDADKFGDCLGDYASPNDYRPGVLFQTGTVIESMGDFDHLDKVLITTKSGGVWTTTQLEEDDFDWLDINTVGQPCPIDPLHAYSLFYDESPNANIQVTTECDDAGAVDSVGTALPDSCLRDRALHSKLEANKDLITYWPDPGSMYTIDVTTDNSSGHTLVESTVKLCEPVTVDQWNEGCWKARFEDVVEVRLVYIEESAQHGGFHEPAMNGGTRGRN